MIGVDQKYQEASIVLMEAMALSEECEAEHSVAIVVHPKGTEMMVSDSLDNRALAALFGTLAQHHYMLLKDGEDA